jgi:predicted anti-sigma-YlaC factor YlaD
MNCTEYQRVINRLVDLEVKARDSAGLFLHLATCSECRDFYETITRLNAGIEMTRCMGELEPLVRDHKRPDRLPLKSQNNRLAAIMQHRMSLPVPVASIIALLLVFGTLVISSLALRSQDPGTVYITTLPGIEVEAHNP